MFIENFFDQIAFFNILAKNLGGDELVEMLCGELNSSKINWLKLNTSKFYIQYTNFK